MSTRKCNVLGDINVGCPHLFCNENNCSELTRSCVRLVVGNTRQVYEILQGTEAFKMKYFCSFIQRDESGKLLRDPGLEFLSAEIIPKKDAYTQGDSTD